MSRASNGTCCSRTVPRSVEGLVGTPLGRPPVILCATPAYLKAHPPVTRPADLAQHAVLVPGQLVTELRLHRGRTQAQVSLTPRLVVTDPSVVHAATTAGAGIGVLPEFLCRIGLSMNKLERVLPGMAGGRPAGTARGLRPAAGQRAGREGADRVLHCQHGAGSGSRLGPVRANDTAGAPVPFQSICPGRPGRKAHCASASATPAGGPRPSACHPC